MVTGEHQSREADRSSSSRSGQKQNTAAAVQCTAFDSQCVRLLLQLADRKLLIDHPASSYSSSSSLTGPKPKAKLRLMNRPPPPPTSLVGRDLFLESSLKL